MSSHETRRPQPERGAPYADFAWEFLTGVARILVCCGYSPQDLVSTLREICRTLKVPRKRWDPAQLGFLSDLPHVIALWHSDPRYLGGDGKPAALSLSGPMPSLTKLIERALPGEDPSAVLEALERAGGLRRRGTKYVPTDRHLWLRADSGRVHSANALLRMLRTVDRNLAGSSHSAIFERAAMNPHFPVSKLPAFHRDVSGRASRFLVAIDGNMRRHEARAVGGPRTRVGVEVFVFEEPFVRARRANYAAPKSRRTQRERPSMVVTHRRKR